MAGPEHIFERQGVKCNLEKVTGQSNCSTLWQHKQFFACLPTLLEIPANDPESITKYLGIVCTKARALDFAFWLRKQGKLHTANTCLHPALKQRESSKWTWINCPILGWILGPVGLTKNRQQQAQSNSPQIGHIACLLTLLEILSTDLESIKKSIWAYFAQRCRLPRFQLARERR